MPAPESTEGDLNHRFFELWLDAELMRSAAYWAGMAEAHRTGTGTAPDGDGLDAAQGALTTWIASQAELRPGARVLDVDCGWGGALRRLSHVVGAIDGVGLALCSAHRYYCTEVRPHPDVHVTGVSVGPVDGRREFDLVMALNGIKAGGAARSFATYHRLLKDRGSLILQWVSPGDGSPSNARPEPASPSLWNPGVSPSLSDLCTAWDRDFTLAWYEQASADGVRTLRTLGARLEAGRTAIASTCPPGTYELFSERLARTGDQLGDGAWSLHRMVLRARRRPKVKR